MRETAPPGIVSRKTAELCFAAALLIFGIIMIAGAREMETGWGSSGPEAGYFPLRTGVLIVLTAIGVLAMEWLKPRDGQVLIASQTAALNLVLFGVPLVALIAATPWIGIYLAAILYLAIAIGLVGRVSWVKTLAISLLTPAALFVLFEFVFRTPLPKGPLGLLLGML